MAWEIEVKQERRLCKVGDEYGYFHTWEHFSKPTAGGHPERVLSHIFGIVEFKDGVRRVEPTEIEFHDEENDILKGIDRRR